MNLKPLHDRVTIAPVDAGMVSTPEGPADGLPDDFWTAAHGMRSLEPGLSRLSRELEAVLAELQFIPSGPIADRHGSYERQFLRRRGPQAADVLICSLTPASDATIWAAIAAGELTDRDYVRGETRAEEVSVQAVRAGDKHWIARMAARASGLARAAEIWADLSHRREEASVG